MEKLKWTSQFLTNRGVNPEFVEWVAFGIDLVLLILISLLADFIARRILLSLIHSLVKRTKATWDDYFYEQRVFRGIAHLVPAGIVYQSLGYVFNDVPGAIPWLQKLITLYVIFMMVTLINRTLRALENWLTKTGRMVNSPAKTISQVIRLLAFFGAAIAAISTITGIQAGSILGAFAGTTAILILVFQDSIKGLLANFQIHMYDLVKVGDWITFSKFGVDGDVVSIDLTTVKVKNFDKTISTVPATAFVSDSFVNWRGMAEEGARRIKRNIDIDISSIRHLDEGLQDSLKEIDLINEFMKIRQEEIDISNAQKSIRGASLLNGRRQTNIGLYRKYIEFYLRSHESVRGDFTLLVRQLQPTEHGLPIEVYCFVNTTDWAKYESTMADIFDHLYAATRHFDLRLFQSPSGSDIRALAR
ncbi:MAG: hypothetical protein RL754_507 [Bacteroidota bacterium]|jgi:miniconductance mechanosensitive channel